MISKELFCSVIDKIRKQDKKITKFNSALSDICDGYPIFDAENLYLSALLDILHSEMKDETDVIGWWLWENVDKKIGVKIDNEYVWFLIDTPERLYDYLVGDYKSLSVVNGNG